MPIARATTDSTASAKNRPNAKSATKKNNAEPSAIIKVSVSKSAMSNPAVGKTAASNPAMNKPAVNKTAVGKAALDQAEVGKAAVSKKVASKTLSSKAASNKAVGVITSKKSSRVVGVVSSTHRKSRTAEAPNPSSRKIDKDEKIVKLLHFDTEMSNKWVRSKRSVLVGTDEVGRGCLAGPVVAAAVKLPELKPDSELAIALAGLDDSKKLTPRRREELAAILQEHCHFAIAEASVEEIDRINILQASLLAMHRAIEQLGVHQTAVVLIDGNKKITTIAHKQITVIGGDGISASIAAASVVAKVYRDALMCRLHDEHPQYCWESNKGYASKSHCDAILAHGLTAWHRKLFCRKIGIEQLSLLK